MRITKRSVFTTISIASLIGVVAIILGGFYAYNTAYKSWDDLNTWTLDNKFSLPIQQTGNYKIETTENSNGLHVSIPYCTLFKASKLKDSQVEYDCAAIPFSSLELTKRFPDKVVLKNDIVVTVNSAKDELPSEFIGNLNINTESITSIGSEPLPVSIELQIDYKKPTKTLSSVLTHYSNTLNGKKDPYTSSKISSWSIKKVKKASEYTEAEKTKIISEWRESAWKDVNDILKTKEYLSVPNNKELLDKMAPLMASRSVYCPTAGTKGDCKPAYVMNAATNIMYYSYAASTFDKKSADKIAEALRDRVEPFVYLYNKELTKYYTTCDIDTECTFFHRLEAYDYPMCPINEIGKKDMTFTRSLFMDYRYVVMDAEYLKNPPTYKEILAEHAKYKKELVDSGVRRQFDAEAIPQIDKLCFLMLSGEHPVDQKSVDSLKSLYMTFLRSQLYITEDEYLNTSNVSFDDTLFDIVLQSSKLNPYTYSFVPQPFTGYSRLLTGVQLQDSGSEPDGYWSSINATLILLYLTSPK